MRRAFFLATVLAIPLLMAGAMTIHIYAIGMNCSAKPATDCCLDTSCQPGCCPDCPPDCCPDCPSYPDVPRCTYSP
jgi:hypothetical protein